VEYGFQALEMLREIKKKYPKKVSKELLAALEDSLT
jgi:hypothetical protein